MENTYSFLKLSAPGGYSGNNSTDKELPSLSYVSVDEVVEVMAKLVRRSRRLRWISGRPITMCWYIHRPIFIRYGVTGQGVHRYKTALWADIRSTDFYSHS